MLHLVSKIVNEKFTSLSSFTTRLSLTKVKGGGVWIFSEIMMFYIAETLTKGTRR